MLCCAVLRCISPPVVKVTLTNAKALSVSELDISCFRLDTPATFRHGSHCHCCQGLDQAGVVCSSEQGEIKLELQTIHRFHNHGEGPYEGNYHKGLAALRIYANQPARPLLPLHWRLNFTFTYRGVNAHFPISHSVNSVLNMKGPSP